MNLNQFKLHRKERNFTIVDNVFIGDINLSWKAKGILLYLFSRPSDWHVYTVDLINKSTDGEKSLRSGLKELEERGYLSRLVERDNRGKYIKTIYGVYENPQENPYFKPLCHFGKVDEKEIKYPLT